MSLPEADYDPVQGMEPNVRSKKRIVVIGAGMAGLAVAFELARQGHEPCVLEAQNRVGGRVYTLRNFAPGLHAEAGAMRIPRAHALTLRYCDMFGLRLRPFIMECPHAPLYLAGRRMSWRGLKSHPEKSPFELTERERSYTYEELWNQATREIRDLVDSVGASAFDELSQKYGQYSIRSFLLERGYSEGALELYGIMSFREANMNTSIVEHFREIIGHAFDDMVEIQGGMDLLSEAFFRKISPYVHLGARVYAVDQSSRGVVVHYRTAAGEFSEAADYCVCAIPFGVLRHLDFTPPLSKGKYHAIRALNYNPSTKILLQVQHRFWEEEGIVGGATATDLPIRRIVYPSHSPDDDQRGVLLASYTWGQDAARWGALSPADRISLALKDVAKIHPAVLDEFEGGASYAWYNDPFCVGAFALFEPGQEADLYNDIVRPEGRVHFAGEHCSLWHAWIQGALESGVRAAQLIHESR
ncbi:flavin monoamine oxidase family protein [Streptomyces sp. NPDC057910]|uniref:flavin monoamine oxidase family protein n=1 Tax=Streptomyces sp. NPDC057910 TaxID=3346278 RepID=UPI0036E2D95C